MTKNIEVQALSCTKCGGSIKITGSHQGECRFCKTTFIIDGINLFAAEDVEKPRGQEDITEVVEIGYDFSRHMAPDANVVTAIIESKVGRKASDPLWDQTYSHFLKALYWVCWSEGTTPQTIDDEVRAVIGQEHDKNNASMACVADALFEKAEQQLKNMPENIRNAISIFTQATHRFKDAILLSYLLDTAGKKI